MATPLSVYNTRLDQTKTGAYTLTAADSGLVTNVKTSGTGPTTITLPAAASGLVGVSFTIRNAGPNNGDSVVTLAPNSADAIAGLGFTAAVNKGAQQVAATANAGDEITVQCSGVTGTGAWYVTNATGTWTRVP